MTPDILYCGDPHGDFAPINRAARESTPRALVLLGDYDLKRPLDDMLVDAIRHTDVWWIPGNHDFERVEHFDNLFGSALANRNLHGRVVDIGGCRVAGLGGTFQGKVWHPRQHGASPRYGSRDEYLATCGKGNRWRDGLPLGRRGAIWPEDYAALMDMRADVLVTHEAPSTHRHGFEEIDRLAEAMGAGLIVHGHHHVDYSVTLSSGVRVIGVGLAGVSCGRGS
ncbi:putative phosphodiesterase [Natronocella acetinitrilica]|uniref:Phosphodiesterase n=1 Tax=Natronocella acetinitrilica TaxID=414046 RepID=A0AAE3G934_9GAMM|nr:metallophosphoesterase [Natronocella acetinitrilica]MCP1677288.1 putative phosphodiesterase [Natronocella acetinitrilica]